MDLNIYLPQIKKFKKNNYECKFTLFIPVYNGENTIIRALKSIKNQTFKDYEVIIIDDGSTDRTEEVIKDFLTTSENNIRFYKNERNIHKMGTILKGLELAKGEFFLIHDADDECLPDALKIYNEAYESIPNSDKKKISGITANCIDHNGNFIGTNIDSEVLFCNTFEYYEVYGIEGEKWGPTKTDVLKQIVIDKSIINQGLIPEAYLWLPIAKAGYVTMYLQSITRIYHLSNENNLSSLKYDKKSFGMAIYGVLFINYFSKTYLFKFPKPFVKRLISLILASNYLDYSFKTFLISIQNNYLKILFVFLWPFRKIGKRLTNI